MATVIALINQKGGVGKTTSTINIAAALHNAGKSVLAIDLDPQGSLTVAVGEDPVALEKENKTISSTLIDGKPLAPMIIKTSALPAIIPSFLKLSKADLSIARAVNPPNVLNKHISTIRDRYDFILIDCPPNLSQLSINALVASDGVLIPVKTDFLSVHGVPGLLDTIQEYRSELNPKLKVIGCIPTMYKQANNIDKEALDYIHSVFEGVAPVFEPIKQATHIERAHVEAVAAINHGGRDNGTQGYLQVANYLIENYG